MRFLGETMVGFIAEQAALDGTYRVVLPSYPAGLLRRLGEGLEERSLGMVGRRVRLAYGVAAELGEVWAEAGSAEERADLAVMQRRGWYSAERSLTSLRNLMRGQDEDALLIVLAGCDRIADQASLQDFFQLNDGTVWRTCMGGAFAGWVRQAFGDVLEEDDPAINALAEALRTLFEQGLGDLLAVSSYLEGLDLRGVTSGSEALRLVLGDLRRFGLPPMVGARGSKRGLGYYIVPAQEFGNYALFLDASARKKAHDTLTKFMASRPPEPDEGLLGRYRSVESLVAGLRGYIDTRSETERERLLTVDFPYLYDKVLGYRERGTAPKASVTRLRGTAPEVFLRALWLTLGEFSREARERGAAPTEELRVIAFKSISFRHDIEGGEEDDRDEGEAPFGFLRRLLGGVDALLEGVAIQAVVGEDALAISSALCPRERDEIAYKKSTVAEPALAFNVELGCPGRQPHRKQFMWSLPRVHPSRVLVDMLSWAQASYAEGTAGNALFAYGVPYLPELFAARDEEEVVRVLGLAAGSQDAVTVNLLAATGIDAHDPALTALQALSAKYQLFLQAFANEGFFAALASSYVDLRSAYLEANRALLRNPNSVLGPLLMKAFWVVPREQTGAANWAWKHTLEYAVATPLHPAVLDMIQHQCAFLCECLGVTADDALREAKRDGFSQRTWDRMADMAQIVRPVFAVVADNRQPDSRSVSYGYFHRLGTCTQELTEASARLLLDYEEDEEDIGDAELFRETGTSTLVYKTLLDYCAVHGHADDGLAVGAYCGAQIQPVIAGIDAFLREVMKERDDRPYSLNITVFSGFRDDSAVTQWLDAWRDSWEEPEAGPSAQHYARCRISLAYRVLAERSDLSMHARLFRETDLDVLFLTDFVEAKRSRFEPIEVDVLPDDGYRQFPILDKPCPALRGGGMERTRERVLSHRRFVLASTQAELTQRVASGAQVDRQQKYMVVSESDYEPWEAAVGAAHEGSTWVVCIDAVVDEQLLRSAEGATRKRELVGFGTGVGGHGERNYTVSTEQFALADIEDRIGAQLAALFTAWERDTCKRVAKSLIAEASGMAGLSVVKATGPSEYVRDYIAYATVRKLLKADPEAFCDDIVSLDAFSHWFDGAAAGTRPDLLRLQARLIDGYLDVEAQILECKLAKRSEAYLDKAQEQVAAGLRRLVACFEPREDSRPIGIGDRPDQRFWWMQLHRLLASRGSTDKPHEKETLRALERLAEGFFSIRWRGAVVAIWTDEESERLLCEARADVEVDGQVLHMPTMISGGGFVRRVCLDEASDPIAWDEAALARSCRLPGSAGPAAETPDLNRAHVESAVAIPEQKEGGGFAGAGPVAPGEPASTSEQPVVAPVEELQVEPPVKAGGQAKGPEPVVEPVGTGGVVQRVLVGQSVPGGRDVYWEFGHPELPNRHILVFGASGTGKTYTIQALLCELGRAGQNAVIVDYTNGFTTAQLEQKLQDVLNPKQHTVANEPLPVNPFRTQSDLIEGKWHEESPSITSQRVTGVFAEIYALGDQQKAALYRAIRDGLKESGNGFDLCLLVDRLERMQAAGGTVAGYSATVLSKIEPFVDMHPFGAEDPESWGRLYRDDVSRCHIIQLQTFAKDMAQLITEFALIDLYRYYRAKGSKDEPRVVVLDEVQNLDLKLKSPLGQLLTEGRKFGFSLVLATQTLSSLNSDARDRLFQASHKLFFKPADTELKNFAQILEDSTGDRAEMWIPRLSGLSRGECYSLGPARNDMGGLDMKRCQKIRVTALEGRF